jgi:hypothetical protein
MLDQFELFFMAEQDYLRLEAMDLFEQCLTEGSPDNLMSFIEAQIALDPPRLDLLHQIAEDLHQRLLALREYHFEVRDRVMRTIRTDFQVDLSEITPPNTLESYHLLEVDELFDYVVFQNPHLSSQKMALLRKALKTSREMTAQLRDDVLMTEGLFVCLMDWIDALTVTEVRRYWGNNWEHNPSDRVH